MSTPILVPISKFRQNTNFFLEKMRKISKPFFLTQHNRIVLEMKVPKVDFDGEIEEILPGDPDFEHVQKLIKEQKNEESYSWEDLKKELLAEL